jgi:hypothetical protein
VSSTRTDVIAYIENPNASYSAKGAKYHIELYDASRAVVDEEDGTIDLPPAAVAPIYIPNAYQGTDPVAQSFLTFPDTVAWEKTPDTRIVPVIDGTRNAGTTDAPRIIATVENPSVSSIPSTKLIVVIFDSAGNAIAASQTILPALAGEAKADATFTWNVPFSAPAARIDVRPVVPL